VGTVKSRVFRARGQLRELLSGTLGRRVRLRDGDK
jgi:DNA-directed RNA polymerase specialized sigma24 family protein